MHILGARLDDCSSRPLSCQVRISAIAQHDCDVLHLSVQESASLTVDAQLCVQSDILALGGSSKSAAIIEVDWEEGYMPLDRGGRTEKKEGMWLDDKMMRRVTFDSNTMKMVDAKKVILLDALTHLPLLLYACGEEFELGCALRSSHLAPLGRIPVPRRKFNLGRTSGGFGYEEGHVEQRQKIMVFHRTAAMPSALLCHRCLGSNNFAEHVINKDGDLGPYANTLDELDFWSAPIMMNMYNDMASMLLHVVPLGSTFTAAIKATVDT
jgi:hypothetical protein